MAVFVDEESDITDVAIEWAEVTVFGSSSSGTEVISSAGFLLGGLPGPRFAVNTGSGGGMPRVIVSSNDHLFEETSVRDLEYNKSTSS